MLLQTVTPVSVLGTTVLLALFLSITAHVAARNVLGDVDPRRALYVGPLPAVISVVGNAFDLSGALILLAALLIDGTMFWWSYEQPRRVVAVMTLIHAVVTTLLSGLLLLISVLLASMPG
ncbi:hypothetical protein EXE46_00515 [Halorubrum sp. GN11_10-6_MGM]|uniref:DUF7473 family protein n=1 Tax=Halorubrum sp. GN11_10-6_MGM TaxID=2518112 RepID=UPI0010F87568|nr:hypothetical protein [Halorubrum sp. GN11_10-6_MGM]TKX76035.1 hypothetical protein EXE46_00515 [Halorubrum sp. GN11_10-6_MGM]